MLFIGIKETPCRYMIVGKLGQVLYETQSNATSSIWKLGRQKVRLKMQLNNSRFTDSCARKNLQEGNLILDTRCGQW